MRIVTNQGSNLHPDLVAHYEIDLVAQEICVDGARYDTRAGIELDQVDTWVQTARDHPVVLGSSAVQLANYFVDVAKQDLEILFVTSSSKIVGTHQAAATAMRTLAQDRRYRDFDVRLVDSGLTDVGAALPVLLACEARRAGETLDQIESRISGFCRIGHMAVYVSNLDGLIKGGRATFLQSWLANLLRVRPILGFDDGELRAVAKLPTREDEARALALHLAKAVGVERVWAGVSHGNDPERANRLVAALEETFQVDYLYAVPTTPSIYLHTGAGSVAATVFPAPSDLATPPTLPFER